MASIVVLVVVSLELGHFFGFDVQKSLNVRFIILLPGKVKIKRLAGATIQTRGWWWEGLALILSSRQV